LIPQIPHVSYLYRPLMGRSVGLNHCSDLRNKKLGTLAPHRDNQNARVAYVICPNGAKGFQSGKQSPSVGRTSLII